MKKFIIFALTMLFTMGIEAQTKKVLDDGTTVINTTSLCKTKGYKGATPVEVHIKKGKVTKIVALKSRETPKYYKQAQKAVFAKFEGLKVSKALSVAKKNDLDGCTGATISSRSLMENIKVALQEYKK